MKLGLIECMLDRIHSSTNCICDTFVVQLFCNNNEVNAAADNRYIQNKSERNSFWWLICVHEKKKRKKWKSHTNALTIEMNTASHRATSSGASHCGNFCSFCLFDQRRYVIRDDADRMGFFFSKDLDQNFLFRRNLSPLASISAPVCIRNVCRLLSCFFLFVFIATPVPRWSAAR